MLFDLRGRGRRRTVKIVYVALAFLMGGGLVLFGIGGSVSGGLIDAITERSGSGDDGSQRLLTRERQLEVRVRRDRTDAAAWAALARVRYQLASRGENYDPQRNAYTAEGAAELRAAGQAWQRHLAIAKQPDDRIAALMVQGYVALNRIDDAVRAQEAVAEVRDTKGAYTQLAALAWQAGQTRKGDLARDKALKLEEPDLRESLRGQLKSVRDQALAAAAGAQSGG